MLQGGRAGPAPCSFALLLMTSLKRKKLSDDEYIRLGIYWRRLETLYIKTGTFYFYKPMYQAK